MQQGTNKRLRWYILYSVAGGVDFAQAVLDATGAGVLISELLEAITPFVLLGLMGLFHIISVPRLISLVLAGGFDALSGGLMPFWAGDVGYVHWSVNNQERRAEEESRQSEFTASQSIKPFYQDGMRAPRNPDDEDDNQGPRNMDGIRAPGGGLR